MPQPDQVHQEPPTAIHPAASRRDTIFRREGIDLDAIATTAEQRRQAEIRAPYPTLDDLVAFTEQIARRRLAALRLEPLEDGRLDPDLEDVA
jgi:hypothetical protein